MLVQPQPPNFKNHVYEFSFDLEADESLVWQWLNDPKTFTDTQVWPYKVEFYSPDPDKIPNGFHEQVLTNHSGPLITFAGVLTKIEENKYRDLQYFYGSYAFSFRWIRPYRLEFRSSHDGGVTTVTCTLSSYVKPSFYNLWTKMLKIFWGRFPGWASKSVKKLQR